MTESSALTLGFSPCPNDTYIFNALVHGRVALHQVAFAEPLLEDVETLNAWALGARLDVSKISCHALGHVLDRYVPLRTGAALGRGCGPLLISGAGATGRVEDWRIAIPGEYTTAALLLRLYRPACRKLTVMRFDRIMAAISSGQVDGGVIIHESRFTYQEHGLHCVQDLGAWWEEATGLPIPLGCIVARRTLAPRLLSEIETAIGASVRWADEHPGEGWGYIRRHAQEMEEAVMQNHINLYVNHFSRNLGDEGLHAMRELLRRGAEAGVFPRPLDNLCP
ncbi:MAG: 1,4-dihydroxy-6-naphthoate synthase [Desulfobulbus sp.]|jgi:1,4-dihydroxy-6-naphthoate synthase|nr:1,4-dihydroxy-6-naphthoate synthase [Desulfobulbus sp.]